MGRIEDSDSVKLKVDNIPGRIKKLKE